MGCVPTSGEPLHFVFPNQALLHARIPYWGVNFQFNTFLEQHNVTPLFKVLVLVYWKKHRYWLRWLYLGTCFVCEYLSISLGIHGYLWSKRVLCSLDIHVHTAVILIKQSHMFSCLQWKQKNQFKWNRDLGEKMNWNEEWWWHYLQPSSVSVAKVKNKWYYYKLCEKIPTLEFLNIPVIKTILLDTIVFSVYCPLLKLFFIV